MLENKEGRKTPQITVRTRRDHAWLNVDSETLFAGKTVMVFSLPGAYTPTCSSAHVFL